MKALITLTALAAFAVAVSPAGAAGPLKPPVVRESFTPLPCSTGTTLGREGCAEQQILRTDKKINALARAIFVRLPSRSADFDFIHAQRSWIDFRNADCLSVSDVYQGGN